MGELGELLTAALHVKRALARLMQARVLQDWRKRLRDRRRGFGDADIASLTAKIEAHYDTGQIVCITAAEERVLKVLEQRNPQLLAPQRAQDKRAA